MFILRDLLATLQEEFSTTKQGQKRKVWLTHCWRWLCHSHHQSPPICYEHYRPCSDWRYKVRGFMPLWQAQRYPENHCGELCGDLFLHRPQRNELLLRWMIR